MPTPLLKLGGVSRATNVPLPTLSRWFDRGTIESCYLDSTTSGSGEYRRFSRNTVNKIAIARKLIGLGIAAGPAVTAAAHFTDFGDDKRPPNELYEFGRTVLVHTESGTSIRNLDSDVPLSEALGRPFQNAVIIDIGPIITAVTEALKKETK
jgi:hypothetical protein